MKRANLINVFSWALTHISWITMVFSPVAYGEQAQKLTAENLKIYASEFGLNKKITLAEFWEKSKYYYPGYMYDAVQAFVQKNPNVLMPQVEIKSSKSPDGQDIPVISFTQNGKTQTVQIYGESEKFVKMNGVVLSESETKYPQKMFSKMLASDPKLAKDYELNAKLEAKKTALDLKRPFKDFSGLPRFNKKIWAAMDVRERVTYIVEMRLLNEKAENVLRLKAAELKKNKKTSAFEYLKKYEAAWSFLIGQPAEAANYSGQHCINQGFVAESSDAYNKKSFNYRTGKNNKPLQVEACNLKDILSSEKYSSNEMVKSAISSCPGSMPCNPLVYSYNSEGKAFCSDSQNSAAYQQGTHYKGSCDNQSRLSSGFVDATNEGLRSEADQNTVGNNGKPLTAGDRKAIQKKIEDSQAADSFLATENFLKGMLKGKGGKDSLIDQLNKKEWSKDLEDQLLSIQAEYEKNANESMDLCSADLNKPKETHEPNYRNACEQLHRRWLFSQKIIDKLKCKDDQIRGEKVCMTKPAVIVVQPSVDCPKPPPVVAEPVKPVVEPIFPPKPDVCVAPDPIVPTELTCAQRFPGATGMDDKCLCEKSKKEPELKKPGFFSNMWSKITHKEETKKADEYECAGGFNWLILGGIALAGLALWALFGRNKGPKAPEEKTCASIGKTGTFPYCSVPTVNPPQPPPPPPQPPPPGKCAAGQTGTPPNCVNPPPPPPVILCPTGTTGTYPACTPIPPTCSGGQTLIGGSCGCSNASSCIGSLNQTSCVCSEGNNGGGTGGGGSGGGGSGGGGVPPRKTNK